MFFRQLSDDLQISLSIPQYAEEMFALIDQNREFLKQWLPWLDSAQTPADTVEFLTAELARFQKGVGLHATIFYQGKLAGAVGYNQIDSRHNIGVIGYWLAADYNGKGIMTQSVKDLLLIGQQYYSLKQQEIHCAVDNIKSRAIAERLGFQQEGVIHNAERLYGRYVNHLVYALKESD
jgi:ribosomal-protein-serine acetyltransferase